MNYFTQFFCSLLLILLFHFSPTGKVFVIGNCALPNWPIIYCNDAFISTFGWTRSDIIGQPVTCGFLYGCLTDAILMEELKSRISDEEEYECETTLYKKDGKFYYLYFTFKLKSYKLTTIS